VTVEQFRELPLDDGPWLHELHYGEVVTSPRPESRQYKLQTRLSHLLEARAGNLGVAGIETPFRAVPEFELRAADVAFVSQERWDGIDPEDDLRGAPKLVIEVKSDSDTWPELRERASLCLANGCQDFWIVDEKARTITAIAPDGKAVQYAEADSISLAVVRRRRSARCGRFHIELSQMLTRLYIDNFRCFVKFEYRPARTQLILGGNGSGKSSLIEALLFLRRFAVQGDSIQEDPFLLHQRTRWLVQREQTFELEANLDAGSYRYRLEIDELFERPMVKSESVHLGGRPIFEFTGGEAQVYDDSFEPKPKYPIDWYRSALATVRQGSDNEKLIRFRDWLAGLVCFRMNPFAMGPLAETAQPNPKVDLSNIASWYRYFDEQFSKENDALTESLRETLDGFEELRLLPAGGARVLVAQFAEAGGTKVEFNFSELSEGQRCLICLYAILHFVLAKGHTVILDEPDNFISLREIQPWLMAASDAVGESRGQLLIISHHPEIINQWATSGGVRFVRSGIGPVQVEVFHFEPDYGLEPAELVARGWENG
jgi:Uma2 family endonuclease/predicted ATPase